MYFTKLVCTIDNTEKSNHAVCVKIPALVDKESKRKRIPFRYVKLRYVVTAKGN